MNYQALKDNLMYMLKESQIKIGYTHNAVTLNYPVDSLNRLLETDSNLQDMKNILQDFSLYVRPELGILKIAVHEGKFGITIPADGVKYVHENIKDSGFLTDLVALVKSHASNVSIDDVLKVFEQYSDCVRCVKADCDEFQYIIWFENGVPDAFMYCIDIDLGHLSYHRLTYGDFKALGFDDYLK